MEKCIHIDMDCFYAAIEERENPALRGKPIAVGGGSRRGVICTANYEARKFGCHSAMPGFKALQLCPQLIILPVRFDLYRSESARIRAIFGRFTEKIEPLSLDEAYLDVSHWKSQSSAIASEIRAQILEETGLTASAGIASNKMLAKIASDWHKPNGQFEIKPEEVEEFMFSLPVSKLWGVGKKMREQLSAIGVNTCGDLQRLDKIFLAKKWGRWGLQLYELSRGIDKREIKTQRSRKSITKEHTFLNDISSPEKLLPMLKKTIGEVLSSFEKKYNHRQIRALIIKLKFNDFTQTTAEKAASQFDESVYINLLYEAWSRGHGKPVRLFGLGVRLKDEKDDRQMNLF